VKNTCNGATRTGANINGCASDGTGGGDATADDRSNVGDSLSNELHIGTMAFSGNVISDDRQ
jgi:hypothetical protein